MGTLDRLVLSDGQCDRLSAPIIGDDRTRGSNGRANRMLVEAVPGPAQNGHRAAT